MATMKNISNRIFRQNGINVPNPPNIVPSKIQINVLAENNAVAFNSLLAGTNSGKIAYLTGANNAELIPIKNNVIKMIHGLRCSMPIIPNIIMITSILFKIIIKLDLEYLSANSPPKAHITKKGTMNIKAASAFNIAGLAIL